MDGTKAVVNHHGEQPTTRPMNPRLIGVLGMGSVFPRRGRRDDLVDLSDVWSGERRARNSPT